MQLKKTICDVCLILDNDETEKYCFYCSSCKSWICTDDTNKWNRRFRALVKGLIW